MKKILLMAILIFTPLANSWAGGGSSGVGSATYVGPDIVAVLPEGMIANRGDGVLIDAETQEPLIQVETVSAENLGSETGDYLAQSTLGAVHGFEFLPSFGSDRSNRWAVCNPANGECLKLTPLSRTNLRVPAIVGALRRVE